MNNAAMSFDLRKILDDKRRLRRELAARPTLQIRATDGRRAFAFRFRRSLN